jgi:biotin carboxyl carrier protein
VRFRVAIAGAEHEIEVTRLAPTRYRIAVGSTLVDADVDAVGGERFRFTLGDGAHGAAGAAWGSERHLWCDGRHHRYAVARGAAHLAFARSGDLKSPAPGVVAEVAVTPGARVRKGEKLIVLESMKMFFPVVAPRDGRVARILCARGETVQAGVLLVDLEEEGGGGGGV